MTKGLPPLTRRSLLAATGASALLGISELTPSAVAQSSDPLQAWLAAHAIPIRTVDPQDDDFSDLDGLASAIGSARVVQLGEPSHNAGTCFAAKVRLIKFLHQHLGFDVVAWESGIYDVELVEAGLRSGEAPGAAARRGILENWSGSEECRPLFEYAQQSHKTDRPLAMAGFDSDLTSPFTNFATELRSCAALPKRASLKREATIAAEQMIRAFGVITAYVEGVDRIHAEVRGAGLK
jgi:erythromycin esterase-like protein